MGPEDVTHSMINSMQQRLYANRSTFTDQLRAQQARLQFQLGENISADRRNRLTSASRAVDNLANLDLYRRTSPAQWQNLGAQHDTTFRNLRDRESADRRTLARYLTDEDARNGQIATRNDQVVGTNTATIDATYATMSSPPSTEAYWQARTAWETARADPAVATAATARDTAQSWQTYNRAMSATLTAISDDEKTLGEVYEHHGTTLMRDAKIALPWSANQIRAIKESGGQSIELLKDYVRGPGLESRGRSTREQIGITAALAEKYRTGNCGENAYWLATEAESRLSGANIPTSVVSHDADHAFFVLGARNYPESRTTDTWPPDENKPHGAHYNLATVHRQASAYSGSTMVPVNYRHYAQQNYLHGTPDRPPRRPPFKRTRDALNWVKSEHPRWREHVYNITRAASRHGNVTSSDSGVTITSERLRNPMSTPNYTTATPSYPSNSNNSYSPDSLDLRSLSVSSGSSSSAVRQNPVAPGSAFISSPGSGYAGDRSRSVSQPDSASSSSDDGRSRRSDAPSPESGRGYSPAPGDGQGRARR